MSRCWHEQRWWVRNNRTFASLTLTVFLAVQNERGPRQPFPDRHVHITGSMSVKPEVDLCSRRWSRWHGCSHSSHPTFLRRRKCHSWAIHTHRHRYLNLICTSTKWLLAFFSTLSIGYVRWKNSKQSMSKIRFESHFSLSTAPPPGHSSLFRWSVFFIAGMNSSLSLSVNINLMFPGWIWSIQVGFNRTTFTVELIQTNENLRFVLVDRTNSVGIKNLYLMQDISTRIQHLNIDYVEYFHLKLLVLGRWSNY